MNANAAQREARIARHSSLRRRLLPVLIAGCFGPAAVANPVGPQVINGQVGFNNQGGVLSITNTPGAIINWQSFSINPGELTRFIQQNPNSAVLNRIIGQDPTQILGALQSNGRVFLVNPNGIVFGQGAQIDVNGLVASTLNISNEDFINGRLNFKAGDKAGNLKNQGAITTPTGGQVYLIAPNVENSGIITSPKGEVMLAAGHTVQLVDSLDPNMQVVLSAPDNEALNLGRVIAEGGKTGIYGALIKQRGVVSANSAVVGENGKIVFKASKETILDAGSKTTATGVGKGGEVIVQGAERVGLLGDAQIDASGNTGGGMVLIGGDYQGKNRDIVNAKQTLLSQESIVRADALKNGDGGKVIAWGNETTQAYGKISVRGGEEAGNGGFIETSGHYLDMRATVDARAPHGTTGMLLLDPSDVYIASSQANASTAGMTGTASVTTGAGSFTGSTSSDTLLDSGTLGTALGTSAVTVTSSSSIKLVNAPSWSSGNKLTLTASDNVEINGSLSAGTGLVDVNANKNISVNAALSGTTINLYAGQGNSVGGIDLNAPVSATTLGLRTARGDINQLSSGIVTATTLFAYADQGAVALDSSASGNSVTTLAGYGNSATGTAFRFANATALNIGSASTGVGSGFGVLTPNKPITLRTVSGDLSVADSTYGVCANGSGSPNCATTGTGGNISLFADAGAVKTTTGSISGDQLSIIANSGVYGSTTTAALNTTVNSLNAKNLSSSVINITNTKNLTINDPNSLGYGVKQLASNQDLMLSAASGKTIGVSAPVQSTNGAIGIDGPAGVNLYSTTAPTISAGSGGVKINASQADQKISMAVGSKILNTGGVSLTSDHIQLLGAIDAGVGIVTLSPTTLSASVRLGGTATGANNTSGVLEFSDTELGTIKTSGGIWIGDANTARTGQMEVAGALNLTTSGQLTGPLTLNAKSGDLLVNGTITTPGNLGLYTTGTLSSSASMNAGGSVFITADKMALTTAAGKEVVAQSGNGSISILSNGNVDLGSVVDTTPGILELSRAELGTFRAASVGITSASTRSISVTDSLAPANVGALVLGSDNTFSLSPGKSITVPTFIASAKGDLTIGTGASVSTSTLLGLSTTTGSGKLTNSGSLASPQIVLTSSKMALDVGTVNAGAASGTVDIVSAAPIDLGVGTATDATSNLELNNTELNSITASRLTITSSPAGTGNITIQGAIAPSPAQLKLVAGGTVSQAANATIGGSGPSMAVSVTGTSVNLPEANPIGVISGAATSTSGSFIYRSLNQIAVSSVANVNGISLPSSTTGVVKLASDTAGIMQSQAIDAQGGKLILEANGPAMLNLTGNTFGTLAAKLNRTGTGTKGYSSIYTAHNLTIGSGTGVDGTTTITGIDTNGYGLKLATAATYGINVANPISAGADTIELATDSLTLSSTILASEAHIRTSAIGRPITVGSSTCNEVVGGGCLALTNLYNVHAGTIGIGSDDNTQLPGNIYVAGITNGTSLPTDINPAYTTRIGLLSGGSVSQNTSTGAITVQDLGVRARGSGTVNLGATNMVTNLAALTSGGSFSFKNGKSLNVSTISGGTGLDSYSVNGILTNNGNVDITVTGEASQLGIPAQINAGTGTVTLTSSGSVYGSGISPDIIGGVVSVTTTGGSISGDDGLHINAPRIAQLFASSTATPSNGFVNVRGFTGLTLGQTTPNESAAVSATGSVTIRTNEPYPLTVNGSITAGGDISLTAGNGSLSSTSATMLTINRPITTTGAITLAGNTVTGTSIPTGSNVTLHTFSGTSTSGGSTTPPPTVGQCVATPSTAGCSAVLPTVNTCTAAPTTAGCTAVLPSVSTCTTAPTTAGCSAVLPSVSTCTSAPSTAGCSVVLPTVNTCTAAPTTAGCTAVLPSVSTCTTAPTTAGCSAVLPSVSTCTSAPSTAGCSVVLPTVDTCTAAPSTAGCTAVLPTLSTCTVAPATAGCTAVLPTVTTCTTAPSTPGCTVVMPTLSTCTSAPTTPGCTAVLPTLSACTSAPTTAGCSAVLPTLSQCSATPTLAGCEVVVPVVSQCITNPSAPGCGTVLPPTQSAGKETVTQTVTSTTNTIVNSTSTASNTVVSQTGGSTGSGSSGGGGGSKPASDEKKDEKKTTSGPEDNGAKKNEPAKKMYCN